MLKTFRDINKLVLNFPHFKSSSRIGDVYERINVSVSIDKPCPEQMFACEKINRIPKEYAEKFWEFMISGGTDATEVFKDYPSVAKFIDKPKTDALPANFNTFYGPRIAKQLPAILKELRDHPDSRRAVIHILQESDQLLLDSDETLEYPCCDGVMFLIRDGKLHSHVHMRSQNCAIVMQLDFYLQSKILHFVADQLGLPVGKMNYTIVSAHIFERDFEYIKQAIV